MTYTNEQIEAFCRLLRHGTDNDITAAEIIEQLRRALHLRTIGHQTNLQDALGLEHRLALAEERIAKLTQCERCKARPYLPDVLEDRITLQRWFREHPCGPIEADDAAAQEEK